MLKRKMNIEQARKLFEEDYSGDLFERFFEYQINVWAFAKKSYSELKNAERKNFLINGNRIIVQYNPGRAISTFAVTDEKAIAERKCFLCDENLFDEQIGLELNGKFTMLVNPYPILKRHFTIKFSEHVGQRITENFSDFLEIGKLLGENYFLLYNGPDCGASVPEHRHFQTGIKNDLPIVSEIVGKENPDLISVKQLDNNGFTELFLIDDGLRTYFLLKGKRFDKIEEVFRMIFNRLTGKFPSKRETKINLLLFGKGGTFYLIIFPRKKHRPSIYYEKNNPVKVSPATIDVSGVIVLPERTNFEQINEGIIKQIFGEIFYSKDELARIIENA